MATNNERLEHTEWHIGNGNFLTSPQMVARIAALEAQNAELMEALDACAFAVKLEDIDKAQKRARAVLAKYA